jgi:hypothetical protein
MTIIELTGSDGEWVYVVCEHISGIRRSTNGSNLISGGNILAEVRETPQQIIAIIKKAMSR